MKVKRFRHLGIVTFSAHCLHTGYIVQLTVNYTYDCGSHRNVKQ